MHRFTDCLVAGKMDHTVDLLFRKQLIERRLVSHIDVVYGRTLAADLFNAVNHNGIGIVKIVGNDHIIAFCS